MAKILQDSSNAKFKFGFSGEAGSPITSAPKLSTQWFAQFKTSDGTNNDEYSAYVKSVSQIGIQTTTQTIDKYGRRIHVPTRVDFPDVALTLYDKVDGSTMNFVSEMYSRYFKNQEMDVDGNLENELLRTDNSGRKLVDADSTFRNFSTVTLYHWFGNQKEGTGYSQRIVLVNPVVTSIQFSPSDYSQADIRTIDINLQIENVVFGDVAPDTPIPGWMQTGFDGSNENDTLHVSTPKDTSRGQTPARTEQSSFSFSPTRGQRTPARTEQSSFSFAPESNPQSELPNLPTRTEQGSFSFAPESNSQSGLPDLVDFITAPQIDTQSAIQQIRNSRNAGQTALDNAQKTLNEINRLVNKPR